MTSVYRLGDELDRLIVRCEICVRERFNEVLLLQQAEAGLRLPRPPADVPPPTQTCENVYSYDVRWQQKISGPYDATADDIARLCEHLSTRKHVLYTYINDDKLSPLLDLGRGEYELPTCVNAHGWPAPILPTALAAAANNQSPDDAYLLYDDRHREMVERRLLAMEEEPLRMFVAVATCEDTSAFEAFCRGELHDPPFTEKIVCALRAYPSRRLEMTPGFSISQTPIFDDDAAARVPPPKYRVPGAAGFVLDYTLTNATVPMCDEDEWRRLEEQHDAMRREVNEERWRSSFLEAIRTKQELKSETVSIRLEVRSAMAFECDWLYVDYELYLPRGWRAADDCQREWVETTDGELASAGCTQLSKNAVVGCSSADDEYARPIVSLVGLGLLFGLFVGPSYLLWLLFGTMLLAAAYGVSPKIDSSDEPIAHLNYSIDLLLTRDTAVTDVSSKENPMIYFQVTSRRSFDRYVVEGYTYWRLPTQRGYSRQTLRTWKPTSTLRRHIQDFFLGGGQRLADLRYVAYPPDEYYPKGRDHSVLDPTLASKFGFVTQTAGVISLVADVEIRSPSAATSTVPSNKSRGRQTIDNILANLKQSLGKESKLDFDKNKARSARVRAAELIRQLQAERAHIQRRSYQMGAVIKRDAPSSRVLYQANAGVLESKSTDPSDDDEAAYQSAPPNAAPSFSGYREDGDPTDERRPLLA